MVDVEALLEGVKPPYFANSEWKPGNLYIILVLTGTTKNYQQQSMDF